MIFDIDNWKEIGATLARNKTRTFLTAFGIFWGTAMLAILMGGSQGLQGLLKANFAGFATNSAIIVPGRTSMPYKGYSKGMTWSLTLTDVEMLRKGIKGIEALSPIASTQATVKYKDRSQAVSMSGVEDNYSDVMTPVITAGRFINSSDLSNDRKVCVIGTNVASYLFGDTSPLGKYVVIDNVYYLVVGVACQKSEIQINGRIDDSVMTPLTTMMRTYNMGERIHYLMMVAAQGYHPSDMKERISHIISLNHPVNPNDKQAIWFMDISQSFEMVDKMFTGVDILLLFVGLSSLLAGVIGVGNIMWIVVKERTKEFGIRRALGAKPRTVLTQILSESVVLTLVAGTAGICFAVGILAVTDHMIAANDLVAQFQITFFAAIAIMVVFTVLGTAAGTIPALKAMRIKPVEALNDK